MNAALAKVKSLPLGLKRCNGISGAAMQLFTLFFSLLAVALATLSTAVGETHAIAISPDGRAYAALQDVNDNKAVVFYSIDEPDKKPTAVMIGDSGAGLLSWSGPSQVLVQIVGMQKSVRVVQGLENMSFSRWISVNADSGKVKSFFDNETGQDYEYSIAESGVLLATLPEKGNDALFSRSAVRTSPLSPTRLKEGQDEITYALYRVNTGSGRVRRERTGEPETHQWIVDEEGAIVARIDLRKKGREMRLHTPKGRTLRQSASINLDDAAIEQMRVVGRGQEPGKAVAYIRTSSGEERYVSMNIETGVIEAEILAVSAPVEEEIYDPLFSRAHAVVYQDGSDVHHFHPENAELQQRLEQSLPGAAVLIASASANSERFIIKAMYADKADEWYFYDQPGKRLELIGRS